MSLSLSNELNMEYFQIDSDGNLKQKSTNLLFCGKRDGIVSLNFWMSHYLRRIYFSIYGCMRCQLKLTCCPCHLWIWPWLKITSQYSRFCPLWWMMDLEIANVNNHGGHSTSTPMDHFKLTKLMDIIYIKIQTKNSSS